MTSGAPWSVKGIDPKAREVAKDHARRSGMTLGEWLNQMILHDDPAGAESAGGPVERMTRGVPAEAGDAERYEAPEHPADFAERVALLLDRLTDRIESAEARTGQAVTGVSNSVRDALARIEAAERQQKTVQSRADSAAEQVTRLQESLGQRLQKVEDEMVGPRSAETLRALESAIGQVAGKVADTEARARAELDRVARRLEGVESRTGDAAAGLLDAVMARLGERLVEAEDRTADAIAGLRESFLALDMRLQSVEAGIGPQIEQRLEALSNQLSGGLEQVRAEIVETLQAAPEGRAERLEESLAAMADQVKALEQRSHRTIEKMGHEVLNIAEVLNKRVAAAETRTAEAVEQVADEVARVAQTVDARLSRSEGVHAQALEKLSSEIAQITDRLGERIADAERRSAQAIDEIGEQVALVSERVNQRTDRASQELADRIRQSEERTARLLEEARATIERRLAGEQDLSQGGAATETPEMAALPLVAPAAAAAAAFPSVAEAAADLVTRAEDEAEEPAASEEAVAQADFVHGDELQEDPFAGFPPFEDEAPAADAAAAQEQPLTAADLIARAFPSLAPAAPTLRATDPEPEAGSEAAASSDLDDDIYEALEAIEEARRQAGEIDRQTALSEALPHEVGFDDDDDFLVGQVEAGDGADASASESASRLVIDEDDDGWYAHATHAEASPSAEAGADGEADHAADVAAAEEAARADAAFASDDSGEPADSEPWSAETTDRRDEVADGDLFAAAPAAVAAAEPARAPTTREIIEQARAAARAAAESTDGKGRKAKGATTSPLFANFGLSRPKRRAGSTVQTFLMVSGGAAFLGLAAGGIALMDVKSEGQTPDRVAQALAMNEKASEPVAGEVDTSPVAPQPRAAVALAPGSLSAPQAAPATSGAAPAAAEPAAAQAAKADLDTRYADAVRALEAGQAQGLADLKKTANLGHAPAQLYLGKLYEDGRFGVKKDLAEARRWTERAARGGDRRAMHNLALYYFNGEGGDKDPAVSAQWFRRAAERGLVDSQYNLGRLYEEGLGVAQNGAEAYKWFLIAARAGDEGARSSAARVKATLSPEARTVAERTAAGFRAGGVQSAAAADGQGAVRTAQRALSMLGYYQGPADGAASPALRLAVAAYQRDQGLAATGALDSATVARLSAFTR